MQGQSYVKLSLIQTLECDVGAYKTWMGQFEQTIVSMSLRE